MSTPRGWGLSEQHLLPDAVVAFVDGELSKIARDRAADHIAGCSSCAADAAAQRQARAAVDSADAPRVPAGLLAALRAIPVDTPSVPAGLPAALDAIPADAGTRPPETFETLLGRSSLGTEAAGSLRGRAGSHDLDSAAEDIVRKLRERLGTVAEPVEHRPADTDTRPHLREVFARLPEPQRDVLELRFVLGLSTEETADAVGSVPAVVRATQTHALLALRAALSDGR